jgi:hypothetical protein
MMQWLNKFLDKLSDFIAHRKGLIPSLGIILIIFNFILQFVPLGWITQTNLLLHLGLILALIGFMLSWAL